MRLGRYEVQGELGRGGGSIVYRGLDPATGRSVALKLLARRSGEAAQRFSRERHLLARFGEAEGFVPLLDVGEAPEGPFLVMPLLAGGTLRARLAKGALPLPELVALARGLSESLARAHAQGIVHRDLKPENVLFTEAGRPLIADLGLAKDLSSTNALSLTKTGELRGTLGYMSPEQTHDSKAVGPATDVYALGVILYECASGENPFEGGSSYATFEKASSGEFEPLARRRRDLPRPLARAIESALARSPAERPADGAAFARAIARAGERSSKRGALVLAPLIALAVAVPLVLRASAPRVPAGGAPPPPPPPRGPSAAKAEPGPAATRFQLAHVLGRYEWKLASGARHLALAREGTALVVVEDHGLVRVFERASGRLLRCFRATPALPGPIAASPDGARILVGDRSGTSIFDTERGVATVALPVEYERELTAAAWSPAGDRIATGYSDGKIVLRDAEGKVVLEWKGHTRSVVALAFTHRHTLLSVGESGTVCSWAKGGATVTLRKSISRVTAIAVSPDDRLALIASADGALAWLDLEDGTTARTVPTLHATGATSIAFLADGRGVVTADTAGTLALWDREAGTCTREWRGLPPTSTTPLVAEPSGRVLVGGWLRELEPAKGELHLLTGEDAPGWLTAGAFLGEDRVVTGGIEGAVRIWDARPGNPRALSGSSEGITALAVTADARTILAVSQDGALHAWDATSGTCVASVAAAAARVPAQLLLLPDGALAAAGPTGGVALRDPVTLAARPGPGLVASNAELLGFWTDGARTLLWTARPSLERRERGAAAATWTEEAPSGRSAALAVSVAGDWVAVGGVDGMLTVRDLARGALRWKDRAHPGTILAVAASPDGERVITAGVDRLVRVLRAKDGLELDRISLEEGGDMPISLALAPGGERLLVGTARGVVLRFERKP